jgi:hypothetical protein
MGTIVKPKTARLCLSDVAKRAHAALLATGKATPEQIAESAAAVAIAVEDGYTIDIKYRLNTGEQQDLYSIMSPTRGAGENAIFHTKQVLTAKVLAYLLSWSLTDDGTPIPMSPHLPEEERLAALRALDPEIFGAIREAIDWHENAVEKEIAAAKKMRGTTSASSNSSPSPDAVIGVSSGSPH